MARLVAVFLLVSASLVVCCRGKASCRTCKDFAKAFEKGLRDTEGRNFAGGDTSWEEENNLSYAKSEVRLVEVLENICERSDYKCIKFLEENEEDVEKWWFKLRHNGHLEINQWLCNTHLDVCCPENTFGQECQDCPGGRELPCNGHGTCEGATEKDGSGICSCDTGYDGEQCNSCKDGYYNDSSLCLACDQACDKSCTGAGPEECVECANGYRREEEEGEEEREEKEKEEEEMKKPCVDIDECRENTSLCASGTYCDNTPGSYVCRACDRACLHSCSGMGSDKCDECAKGYEDKSENCVDIDECDAGVASCEDGTFCQNTAGSYKCETCDESCDLICTGAGPDQCDQCKDGYTMENGTCIDINECTSPSPPCDNSVEVCVNKKGSFSCSCQRGYIKQKGKCQPKESAGSKKSRKKKRKGISKEEEGETKRFQFPWYHLVLPIVLAYLISRHCQPTLYSSIAILFVVMATALIGQRVVSHDV